MSETTDVNGVNDKEQRRTGHLRWLEEFVQKGIESYASALAYHNLKKAYPEEWKALMAKHRGRPKSGNNSESPKGAE